MRHVVTHDLDMDLARRAAKKAWESYSQRFSNYEPRATWRDDDHADISFRAKGVSLKGAIDLAPGEIGLELEVPFVLRIFRSQAIAIIEQEIQSWIEKARAGEL